LKPLPTFKTQKRPYEARLTPTDSDFLTQVARRSWAESVIVGADTETLDGKAVLLSYEKKKVSGWDKNRNPTGHVFMGHAVAVNGFWECLDGFLDAGYAHTKTKVSKKGKKSIVRRWVSPQFMFWNLGYDAAAILKWLVDIDPALLDKLLVEGQVEVKKDDDKSVEIKYLMGKWLSFSFNGFYRIKNGKRYQVSNLEMWDISQFYFKTPLTVQAKRDLGYGKVETCFDGSRLDASRFGDMVVLTGERFPYDADDYTEEPYWDYYYDDIVRYAKVDAEMCGQLARLKRNEYVESGVRFIRTYSPANVAQNHLLDLGYNQTVNLMENDEKFHRLMEMGQMAYHGGNFDVSLVGTVKDCIQYDLVSAYLYIMYHLPSLMRRWTVEDEKGKLKVEEEMRGFIMQGNAENLDGWWEWFNNRQPYTIGFIYVDMMFPADQAWYPLLCEIEGTLTAPRHFRGVITADELEEALLWNPEKVSYGEWVFHQDEDAEYPFRSTLDRLFRMKMESPKDSAQYKVAKTQMSSLYGKTLQAVENTMGKLWNIGYGSVICGATRARLAKINRLNGKKAISMATDGVIFRKSDVSVIPKRPLDAPFNLGEWEHDAEGDVIILGSGVYSFINEKYDEDVGEIRDWLTLDTHFKTTVRGSAKLFMRKHGFKEWRSFCQHFRKEEVLTLTKASPLSLKQSRMKGEREYILDDDGNRVKDTKGRPIFRMKGDYSHVNIFVDQSYSLKPFGDSTKRKCPVRPETFGDLLTQTFPLVPYESRVEALTVRNIRKAAGEEMENYGDEDDN